jgi:hypothetical protein
MRFAKATPPHPAMLNAFCTNIIIESPIRHRNSLLFHTIEIFFTIDMQIKIRILNMMNKLIN